MAIFKLHANSHVDLLTQDELRTHLDATTTSWFQEKARGLDSDRFDATATVAAGAVTLPPTGQRITPDIGFAWTIQRITADNLATNDTLIVYRNAAIPKNRLGSITATAPFHVGSKGALLRSGERLIITGSSLTATGDITINGEVIKASELDLYKLI